MTSIFAVQKNSASAPAYAAMLRGLVGGSLSIFVLLLLSQWSQHVWVMAPFGASCVLLYAVPQSPLAQPRNIILGHVLSASVGLLMLKLFGAELWSIALAVGIAIALMQGLRCVHPPAGANPLLILLTAQSVDYAWSFLLFPVLSGALTLVGIAWIVNNIKAEQPWPSTTGTGWWSRCAKKNT